MIITMMIMIMIVTMMMARSCSRIHRRESNIRRYLRKMMIMKNALFWRIFSCSGKPDAVTNCSVDNRTITAVLISCQVIIINIIITWPKLTRSRMGSWGQDTVRAGTFWGVLDIFSSISWPISATILAKYQSCVDLDYNLSYQGAPPPSKVRIKPKSDHFSSLMRGPN